MEDNNMMLPLEGSAGYEEKTTGTNTGSSEVEYNEDNIRHLDDMEHIRFLAATSILLCHFQYS